MPPGGTVVPTVFFPGDVPCAFDLRWTLVRRGTELRGIGPLQGNGRRFTAETAVPPAEAGTPTRRCSHLETEEPKQNRGAACHRVALSSRQCSSLATYLVRSIYDGRWCEEGQNCEESDLGDPRLQGNGRRFTAETAVPPGGTVVPTVFFPGDVPCAFDLRWTLVRRGTERPELDLGDPRLQGNGRRFTAMCGNSAQCFFLHWVLVGFQPTG